MPTARTAKPRRPLRRPILILLLLAGIAAAVVYGIRWWTVGRFLESTNDAYLQADLVAVAPKVSGYVSEVLVRDNQPVQAGQALVRIDARDYSATLLRQRATQDARQADITAAQAQLQQQFASVEQARARLSGSQVAARFAAQQAERYRKLAASGAETAERLAEMVNTRDQADATAKSDSAALNAAERQTETLKAQIGQARAQAEAAQAQTREAELNVDDTLVRAGIAGIVGDRTVRIGQFVQPGTRLLSLVPVQNVYVLANFKETQLAHMVPGQKARISVDALGGQEIAAEIDSFAPGTGAQFALLPPENATGNFTKIVQRVPVRIRLKADAATLARLLPGLSVTAVIDTRDHPAAKP